MTEVPAPIEIGMSTVGERVGSPWRPVPTDRVQLGRFATSGPLGWTLSRAGGWLTGGGRVRAIEAIGLSRGMVKYFGLLFDYVNSLSRLRRADTELVILRGPLEPAPPQTCGKVERFHQTLKGWLERQPRARSIAELQVQLDTFREYYNRVRPHRAIGRRPPAAAFEGRPKAIPRPGPLPLEHYRIRHDLVGEAGKVTLRHGSRLHHIGIGRAYAGTRVMILVRDLSVRIIRSFSGS